MKIIATDIADLVIVEPRVFEDERGFFYEAHNANTFKKLGIEPGVTQINHSFSKKGVVRGLHFQLPPYAQTKLVRCVRGSLFDVAVDIRKGSPTYGRWFGVELSAENRRMLFVPQGFAHGFYAMTDCELLYLCGASGYDKMSEAGLRYDDPALGIAWPFLEEGAPNVNERDRLFPLLADLTTSFVFDPAKETV